MSELTAIDVKKSGLEYDPETGLFWRAGSVAGCVNKQGYRQISVRNKQYLAHRLAWLCTHGRWPKDQIDHINHRRDDNRLQNLREATNAEQRKNMKLAKNNTSGFRGVSRQHGKWVSYIKVGGKKKHLGIFENKDNAVIARVYAEVLFGFHSNHGSPA